MIGETITIDEIDKLLQQLAARDQRTTGDADIITWWNDLNNATPPVSYHDAQQAANHYYAVIYPRQKPNERYRLTAPTVIELVQKAHAERLANFVYEDRPDETGAEYVERYNQQLRAVATGERPPVPSITQALKPRPVAALVAGIAAKRVLPPEVAEVLERRRPPGTAIACPVCSAPANQRCRAKGRGGRPDRTLSTIHATRIEQWATGATGCPTCHAAQWQPCLAYGRPCAAHPARIEAAGGAQ